MNTFLTVLALCCATSFAALDFQADQGCIASSWITLGNSEYSYVEKLMTFNDAQQSCQLCGAHLISIDDPAAEDFAELASTDDKPFWIGASDNGAGGDFSWVDGSSFSYTNYKNGEVPTRVAGGANCLYSKNNAFWKATLCSNTRRFVCERDLAGDSAVVGGQVFSTQTQPTPLSTQAQPTPLSTQTQPTPPTTQAQFTLPTTIISLSALEEMIQEIKDRNEHNHIHLAPFTQVSTTQPPISLLPTRPAPTSQSPIAPSTQVFYTRQVPTSQAPISLLPTARVPLTRAPTTQAPTTQARTTTRAPTTRRSNWWSDLVKNVGSNLKSSISWSFGKK